MLLFTTPTQHDPDADTFLGDLSSGEVQAFVPEPDQTLLLPMLRSPRARFPSVTLPDLEPALRRAPTRITVKPLPIPKPPRRSHRRLALLSLMMVALVGVLLATPQGASTRDYWRAKSFTARASVETIVDGLTQGRG